MVIQKKYSYMSIGIMFFIISHAAWIWEGFITMYEVGEFVNRGFLHGFWLPIYGIGSICLITLLGQTSHSIYTVFLFSSFICGFMEYMTSFALERLFHKKWWDYSHLILNFHGRVCIFTILLFGIAGCLLVYYIAPFLNKQISKIPVSIQKFICAGFGILFLADTLISLFHPNAGRGITF